MLGLGHLSFVLLDLGRIDGIEPTNVRYVGELAQFVRVWHQSSRAGPKGHRSHLFAGYLRGWMLPRSRVNAVATLMHASNYSATLSVVFCNGVFLPLRMLLLWLLLQIWVSQDAMQVLFDRLRRACHRFLRNFTLTLIIMASQRPKTIHRAAKHLQKL